MNNEQRTVPEFTAVLRNSILRNISHKATCPACKLLTTFTSKRYISSRDLPPILVVNANVYNDETWEFWQDNRSKTFLQPQVDLHGHVEGADDPEVASYILRVCAFIQEDLFLLTKFVVQAIVIQVKAKSKPSHLVAIVKGISSYQA